MGSVTTYDSTAVRRAAQTVAGSAEVISTSAQPKLNRIRSTLGENMEGDTARALAERLRQADQDIARLQSTLDALSRALYRFAAEIDAADARIKNAL
ncbi:MAG: WXG100 family type VII secretion target [Clostridia bacterium]|nr:WXG100 family type VII secretion target [Clostridia bacterium]MBQ8973775.1 WXG100 family type VII secretion target [Clostridia bacterium]